MLPDIVRLIARTIVKLRNQGGDKEEFVELPNGQKRSFKSLISHHKEFMDDLAKMEEFARHYCLLQMCLGDKLPSKSDVMSIYGKHLCNQLAIFGEFVNIGIGLYLDASAIDHSCDFNTLYVSKGKEIILRTVNLVEDFNDLRITYIPNLSDRTKHRRKELMDKYFFLCDCMRCQDPISDSLKSSILCPSCNIGCVPALENGTCIDCNAQITPNLIEKHKKITGKH